MTKKKESNSKRLTDVEKGVRYIIREALRSIGIKHKSSTSGSRRDNYVATVAYSQRPTEQIEHLGPLFFHYDLEGTVTCRRYIVDETNDQNWRRNAYNELFDAVEIHDFDISDPNFDKQIKEFAAKHIPPQNRQAAQHKTLKIHSSRGSNLRPTAHRSIRNETAIASEKKGRYRRFIKWMQRVWTFAWNSFYADADTFYYQHALKRHFGSNDEEIKEFFLTVLALRGQSLTKIKRDTDEILENQDK